MPRRRRVQEFKRRLAQLIATEEARSLSEARQAWLASEAANPLSDVFWREREGLGPHDPDDDCYFNCPHYPLERARQEIKMFREESA